MSQVNDITNKRSCKQLELSERRTIERMLRKGAAPREIAVALFRDKSTITREIARGSFTWTKMNPYLSRNPSVPDYIEITEYSAELAQQKHENRRACCGKKPMFVACGDFLEFASEKILKNKWSPDAAVGYAKANNLFSTVPCTKTLYNIIDAGVLTLRNIDLQLKVKRKSNKEQPSRRHKRLYGRSIEERPDFINAKAEFGHWEGDSVVGKDGKSSVLTLVERSTGTYIILRTKAKTSEATLTALRRLKRRYGKHFKHIFKSITLDNGSEFADSMGMELLGTIVYYAHPYSAFERGLNEHTNGILRRYLPKGMDLSKLKQPDLDRIAYLVNTLPRKKREFPK